MREHASDVLRNCYLFAEVGEDSLAALEGASRVTRHASGETLFLAGDPVDGLRIVRRGLVRVWLSSVNGKELTLTLLEAGDPLGEIALLDGLPRSANATCAEATECLFLPRKAATMAVERDPVLARHLIHRLCEVVRRNTDELSGIAFRDLDARLAQRLHALALAHGARAGPERSVRLARRFSQTELGQMLGVTREAVNKRLMVLAHDGLVGFDDGHVVVHDMEQLHARAAADRD